MDGETYAAEGYVMLATRLGLIKKTRLAEFSNPMSRGIIAMNIEEGDELIGAQADLRPRHDLPGDARRHGHPLP